MLAPMYDSTSYLQPMQEQDHHTHTAAGRTAYGSGSYPPPRSAGRSLLLPLPAQNQRGQVVDSAGGMQQQPRRAANRKKNGAPRPPSRRSSTTVVATDVANFRAMVQELTGFPAAAIFRPLPRRVHAAAAAVSTNTNPFVGAVAAGRHQQGQAGSGSVTTATNAAGSGLLSHQLDSTPVLQPVMSPQCALPPGVFDGLSDIGSPVFDSWADLSIE